MGKACPGVVLGVYTAFKTTMGQPPAMALSVSGIFLSEDIHPLRYHLGQAFAMVLSPF